MGVTTVEGCVVHVEPYAYGGLYVFFSLYILLQLYFVLVMYSFMKDADLPREQGGCAVSDAAPTRFDDEKV